MKMANDDIMEQCQAGKSVKDYAWPLSSSERWVIQEQFVLFLDVSGFKRKYPKINRRQLHYEEVKHLYDLNILTEQQYSMGVCALPYDDAMELLRNDFPAKYDTFVREKMKLQRESMIMNISAEEMPTQLRKAAKSVSEFTQKLNQLRKDKFQSYYDANTNTLLLPVTKFKRLNAKQTRVSPYPVTVLAGQFATDFKKYTSKELNMLPMNTSLVSPPIEADERALYAFNEKELEIDPDDEIVSEDEEEVAKREAEKLAKKKELALKKEQDEMETASNSSAVSDNTCCTCREKFEDEDKSQLCSVCMRSSHTGCLGIPDEQYDVIKRYKWSCIECKVCAICSQARNEEQILFCDRCDRGYHTFCVALRAIPKGLWTCRICFKEDPNYSERHGGKKMRAQRKHRSLKEYMMKT